MTQRESADAIGGVSWWVLNRPGFVGGHLI
jgi:hypothetical protein